MATFDLSNNMIYIYGAKDFTIACKSAEDLFDNLTKEYNNLSNEAIYLQNPQS